MVPLPRRRLLRAVGGLGLRLSVVLAGCSTDERRRTTPTPSATVEPSVAYEPVFLRCSTAEPVVAHGEPETGEPATVGDQSFTDELLLTADDAAGVSFTRDVDGVDEVRTFLAETDFEREAVYLREQPISACRRLAVGYVTTEARSFDIEFCAPLRPADVACSIGDREAVAAFVRFPFATDEVSGYSIGGGRTCRRPHRPEGSA